MCWGCLLNYAVQIAPLLLLPAGSVRRGSKAAMRSVSGAITVLAMVEPAIRPSSTGTSPLKLYPALLL
jgi:hypothetical protein